MAQTVKFPNGGFVIHKIQYGAMRYSAWYDSNTIILDAEGFDAANKQCDVRRGTKVWKYLRQYGLDHRPK